MAKKKPDKNININIGGDAQGVTIIVGDSNVVGQGSQKPDDIKSRFLVPFPHNPDFVGRDEELSSLHEMLQQKQSIVGIRPTVLVGLGGIGKTQLAVEYAHAHRADYPSGVFWLNAINPLLSEFSDLAEKLEMADRDTPRDNAARKAWDYLDSHPDALVIFDNVLEPSELNLPFSPDLIPANLCCRTLFTTRQRDFPRTFQPFEVKILPEMAAMKLLLRSRPEVLEEHHPEWGWARIVCAELGWLPLALELAAAYLGAYLEVSVTGYLERLRTEGSLDTVDESEVRAVDLPTRIEEILKAAAAGNLELKHQVAVSATLQTQWKRLDDEDAKLLFRAAGQFPEASWILIPRLGLLTGIDSEAKSGYPSSLSVTLKKLHMVSLIDEFSEDRLRLHPLVQKFAASLSTPPESFRLEMAERVAKEFDDLQCVQARVIRYGVDSVIEDLRTALGFCMNRPDTETYSRISNMERVLDREAPHLRNWIPLEEKQFFLQQIRNRSLELRLSDIQNQAESLLGNINETYFLETRAPDLSSPSLVRFFLGHIKPVLGVAVTWDAKSIVSSAEDGMRVWDLSTGRLIRGEIGSDITKISLSRDGDLAITVGKYYSPSMWNLKSGEYLGSLQGHTSNITEALITSDGLKVISASLDKTIRIWDLSSGKEINILKGHADSVESMVITPDDQRMVSSSDNTLKVWDINKAKVVLNIENPIGTRPQCLAIAPDGSKVVIADKCSWYNPDNDLEHTLAVLDCASGQIIHTLTGHEGCINCAAFSMDGRWIVTGSSDRTIRIWDVTSGELINTLTGHGGGVYALTLTADQRWIISGSSDGTVGLWDLKSAVETSLPLVSSPTQSIRQVLGNGKKVIAILNKSLQCWDFTITNNIMEVSNYQTPGSVRTRVINEKELISLTDLGYVQSWNLMDGKVTISSREILSNWRYYSDIIAVSPDGEIAVSKIDEDNSADLDKEFVVWNVLTGKQISVLDGTWGRAAKILGLITMDKKTLVASSGGWWGDGSLQVWDLYTGKLTCSLGHVEDFNALVSLYGSAVIISAHKDKTIRVWDIAKGVLLDTLQGHTDSVLCLDVSRNDRWVVSSSLDHTVKLWNLSEGRCVSTLATDFVVTSLAISEDASTLVAVDQKGIVHYLTRANEE